MNRTYNRGRGRRGTGGRGAGRGGVDVCVCPKCGKEVSHARGVPCTQTKCPECGAQMRGKFCL